MLRLSTTVFACVASAVTASEPEPLPLCPGDAPSQLFAVRVDGREVPVGRGDFNGGKVFHVAAIETDRAATVEVESLGEVSGPLIVRPRRHEIAPGQRDGVTSFEIKPDWKLVIERGDGAKLVLIVLPPSAPPDRDDPRVRYFGPGEHEVGRLSLRSGQTVYLAAGARVRGTLHAFEARDVAVRGRGVWDARGHTDANKRIHGMLFERCQNIQLEGVQVRTGDWWQVMFLLCDDVRVSDLTTLSFGRNNDGIDLDGVRRFKAEDCFIGCGDDGFGWHALDAVAFGEPVTRDCHAERCVIWNEHAGNGMRIGASMETQLVEHLSFTDIDVLHAMNNAIMVDHSDWALVRDVRFERFDNDSSKPLAHIAIERTRYSNANGYRDARGAIEGWVFSNVRTNRGNVTLRARGHGASVTGVCFEHCIVGRRALVRDHLSVGPGVGPVVLGECRGSGRRTRNADPERTTLRRIAGDTLVIDNHDQDAWAFAGQQLRVVEDSSLVGGSAWELGSLGWGHAAVFEPRLEGSFYVDVHHPGAAWAQGRAPWTVRHHDGYRTRVVQSSEAPGWLRLGKFQLDADSWVRLADPHYQLSSGPVLADAVRFTRVKSSAKRSGESEKQ